MLEEGSAGFQPALRRHPAAKDARVIMPTVPLTSANVAGKIPATAGWKPALPVAVPPPSLPAGSFRFADDKRGAAKSC
ncbi:MAG: hypothetical protein M3R07_12980 [Gemmatimonadota bacterium]|nr:hypothetical protein [Gemmatimonadota bacterium]